MMWNGEMSSLVDELKRGGWSCVIGNAGKMTTYSKRGVADLYRILVSEPELLLNSYIADKVVGKGACGTYGVGKSVPSAYTYNKYPGTGVVTQCRDTC